MSSVAACRKLITTPRLIATKSMVDLCMQHGRLSNNAIWHTKRNRDWVPSSTSYWTAWRRQWHLSFREQPERREALAGPAALCRLACCAESCSPAGNSCRLPCKHPSSFSRNVCCCQLLGPGMQCTSGCVITTHKCNTLRTQHQHVTAKATTCMLGLPCCLASRPGTTTCQPNTANPSGRHQQLCKKALLGTDLHN